MMCALCGGWMSSYGTAQVCPECERRTERLRRKLLAERRRAAATVYGAEKMMTNERREAPDDVSGL